MRKTVATFLFLSVLTPGLCLAVPAEPSIWIQVPAGDARDTLADFAGQSRIQLIFRPEHVAGLRTRPVRGNYKPTEALALMIRDLALSAVPDRASGAIAIVPAPGGDPSGKSSIATDAAGPKQTPRTTRDKPESNGAAGIAAGIRRFFVDRGMESPGASANLTGERQDPIEELSPITVDSTADSGYRAAGTLAGTRLRTDLNDVGAAVSVVTKQLMSDLGATDNRSVLTYATNFEIAGITGNYQGIPAAGGTREANELELLLTPQAQTRVRGLVSADNTRSYFRTAVSWDSFNVSRVDLLRGPNSILFGLGEPGGVVNATTDPASLFGDSAKATLTCDQFGSTRLSLNWNRVVLDHTLAVRLAALREHTNFRQLPAYEDDERVYLAAIYRPARLNRDRTRFDLSLKFEKGNLESNRPRTAPPADFYSAWFQPTVIPDYRLPNGTNRNGYADGIVPGATLYLDRKTFTFLDVMNRDLPENAVILNYGAPQGPVYITDDVSGFWRMGRMFAGGARNPDGSPYAGMPPARARAIYGTAFIYPALVSQNSYLRNIGHPFADAYYSWQLTDPAVFDYYNRLIDGPNKREWTDFQTLYASIVNTFGNGRFGYELSYYREDADRGQTTPMEARNRFQIDILAANPDGTANPNVGRAYIQERFPVGTRWNFQDLESVRASAYFTHDFAESGKMTWWKRLLGRHTVNAAYQRDTSGSDHRIARRLVPGDDLFRQTGHYDFDGDRFHNQLHAGFRYYVSPDLSRISSATDIRLGQMDRSILEPPVDEIALIYFDTTWIADDSVDPGDPWINPGGGIWEQAANPANYRGWSTGSFHLVDALAGPAMRDLATSHAFLTRDTIDSFMLTWQGYLFNHALALMYGWREDSSEASHLTALRRPDGGADLDPESYNFSRDGFDHIYRAQSRSYSAVAHLARTPWLQRLPFDLSLSYARGENFNPSEADRRNIFGRPIPVPHGSTEEFGFILATADQRFTAKLTKYRTAITNASARTRFVSQAFDFLLAAPAGRLADLEAGIVREAYESAPNPPDWSIDAQENIHGPAFRQFEHDFLDAYPEVISTWLVAGSFAPMNRDTSVDIDAVPTEDNLSEGYELEITANPSRQIRLLINASKTEARRDNIPGPEFVEVFSFLRDAMFDPDGSPTPAGGLYLNHSETVAERWRSDYWENYVFARQLNGELAGELVKWRVNGVANYTFTEPGPLQGVGFGGAIRWQSGITLGYPRYFDPDGFPAVDVDHPVRSDPIQRFDFWLRYQRPLFENKANWSIQLNLNNAFEHNRLIPVRADPDGTPRHFRIQDGRSWKLTTSLSF